MSFAVQPHVQQATPAILVATTFHGSLLAKLPRMTVSIWILLRHN